MRPRSEYNNGTWIESEEPYNGLRRAMARCPDGKNRIVRLHMAPDTYFSISGRVSRLGTGFIHINTDINTVLFTPNKGRV
jgi:hypothetical protein